MSGYTMNAEDLKNSGFGADDTPPEWEDPIPFNNIKLPSFPVNELPSVISDYVRAVAESTQTAPDMAATASLAILALSLQGKFYVQAKADWREPLNLYTVNIAPPGERKSVVMSLMGRPVKAFEAKENERLAPLIERSKIEKSILEKRRQALENDIAKGKSNDRSELTRIANELAEFKEIKPCHLYCDDITPEKLASVLSDCGGMTSILSSEGGLFDIFAGRYSDNVNIDVLLKAHSGDSIRVDRQGRASEYIPEPALTILLFTQSNVIESLMSNGVFKGRGLCARFLYSIPTSPMGGRTLDSKPIPDILTNRYDELIFKLLSIENEKPQTLTLTEKAYGCLRDLFNMIEPMLLNELFEIIDFAAKFVGMTLRIAGLLHLAEYPESVEISESFMLHAISIGLYYLEHAKAAYQIMGADEESQDAKYLLRRIESMGQDEFTKRDLFDACKGKFKKVDAMEPAMKTLIEMGYIREVAISTGERGRLSIKIIVNPMSKNSNNSKNK